MPPLGQASAKVVIMIGEVGQYQRPSRPRLQLQWRRGVASLDQPSGVYLRRIAGRPGANVAQRALPPSRCSDVGPLRRGQAQVGRAGGASSEGRGGLFPGEPDTADRQCDNHDPSDSQARAAHGGIVKAPADGANQPSSSRPVARRVGGQLSVAASAACAASVSPPTMRGTWPSPIVWPSVVRSGGTGLAASWSRSLRSRTF